MGADPVCEPLLCAQCRRRPPHPAGFRAVLRWRVPKGPADGLDHGTRHHPVRAGLQEGRALLPSGGPPSLPRAVGQAQHKPCREGTWDWGGLPGGRSAACRWVGPGSPSLDTREPLGVTHRLYRV